MTSPSVIAVAHHLWQSTLFALLAASLTLLLRSNSARVRYLLWLAASLKFLVPFALLTAIGAQIPWSLSPAQTGRIASVGQMAVSIMQPGAEAATAFASAAHTTSSGEILLVILVALWALGTLTVGSRWLARWMLVRRALRDSTATSLAFVIPVRSCSAQLEPAVVGVFHPVLLLPQGMEQRLTAQELRAVLAHERCHVAWRDNLAAALHMLAEALFWFYPLIWWLGARLVSERERACDEQVLTEGHTPASYAEGILKVCEHYLNCRLPCAAGVGGATLKQRVEDIMKNRLIERLSGTRRAVLIMLATATVAVPIAVGLLTAPRAHAQEGPPGTGELAFSNVSIQLAQSDEKSMRSVFRDGRFEYRNSTLRPLIAQAYGVQESQVMGQWVAAPKYNITADLPPFDPSSALAKAGYAQMIRNLLAKHFGLIVRRERRPMDGYVLLISSGGSKLKAGDATPRPWPSGEKHLLMSRGSFDVLNLPLSALANTLSHQILHVPVADETGLQGEYSYTVTWPADGQPDADLLASSLEQQLGLHLEARGLNVEVIEIVRMKPPEEVVTAPR
jgi:uncharacterized protein (TIGR03435 family)